MLVPTLLSAFFLYGGPTLNDRLVDAVRQNDLAKAQELIRKGAKANYKSQDRTPVLLEAFRSPTSYNAKGSIEPMVMLLLNSGANAKEIDGFGWNALTLAPETASLNLVKALIAKGAEPNRVAMHGDPAIVRFAGKRFDIVQLLLENGAKVDLEGYFGQTALGAAAQAGRMDIVQYLKSKGANPRYSGWNQMTPMHWAASYTGDNTTILAYLEGFGANVNSEKGVSPLHAAATWGSAANAKWLIEHGASLTAKDGNGRTPLDSARYFQKELKQDRSDVIEVLKKASAG